jgi:hypothetical protein
VRVNENSQAAPTRRAASRLAARALSALLLCVAAASEASAQVTLRLDDGRGVEVEEAWEDAQGVWYRRDNITGRLDKSRVRKIERAAAPASAKDSGDSDAAEKSGASKAPGGATNVDATAARDAKPAPAAPLWIHLAGGAKMQVEEVSETSDGYWYKRGVVSMFLDRARVTRVEREDPAVAVAGAGVAPGDFRWTTGRPHLDRLILENGARHGVDPYLIFCVMEQESQFKAGAVSHKGARGLMQLMPGTARRFGVRDVHDPAQNISGGTRYLKELLRMFGGRVDLALASYNAGEGAVMRYGKTVPPYRETRNYVKRIGERYGRQAGAAGKPAEKVSP